MTTHTGWAAVNPGGPGTEPGEVADPERNDPPPGQDHLPEGGTSVGAHEAAPEEIGESG